MHGPFRGHLMLPRVLVSRCGKNCGSVSRLNYGGSRLYPGVAGPSTTLPLQAETYFCLLMD